MRPGGRGGGNGTEGPGLAGDVPRPCGPGGPARPARAVAEPGPAGGPARACGSCWWTTEDSFVHTLANYFRQEGAEVMTLRAGFPPAALDESGRTWRVSPGPGQPSDFAWTRSSASWTRGGMPVFGVCLGCRAWWSRPSGPACSTMACRPRQTPKTGSRAQVAARRALPQSKSRACPARATSRPGPGRARRAPRRRSPDRSVSDLGAVLPEVAGQRVHERVLVVDEQDPHALARPRRRPPGAAAAAVRPAAAPGAAAGIGQRSSRAPALSRSRAPRPPGRSRRAAWRPRAPGHAVRECVVRRVRPVFMLPSKPTLPTAPPYQARHAPRCPR